MTNPSKAKGTAAETETLRAAIRAGLTGDRAPLKGAQDQGDLWLSGQRVVVEVKAGDQAANPSPWQLQEWMTEAVSEATRVAACDIAVLVVKRKGSARAEHWTAYLWATDYLHLQCRSTLLSREIRWPDQRISLPWGLLCELLVLAGY